MSNAETKVKANPQPRDEKQSAVSAELAATLARYKEERDEQKARHSKELEECRREKLRLQNSEPRDWPALFAVCAKEAILMVSGDCAAKPEFHPQRWRHRSLGEDKTEATEGSK